MAPKRKRQSGAGKASFSAPAAAPRETRSAVRSSIRATRSATRRGDATLNPPIEDPQPRKSKKAKTAPTASPAAAVPSPTAEASSSALAAGSSSASGKTVVIEHCVESETFKKKAAQIKKGLEKAAPGVNVVVNPETPRKGCFEIREEGGDVFESLLDMESPFEPLKALDVKKVVSDVAGRIK